MASWSSAKRSEKKWKGNPVKLAPSLTGIHPLLSSLLSLAQNIVLPIKLFDKACEAVHGETPCLFTKRDPHLVALGVSSSIRCAMGKIRDIVDDIEVQERAMKQVGDQNILRAICLAIPGHTPFT